jgi:hypothetical protein
VTGLGVDEFELQSLTENQFDNINIENRENGTQESDILSEDSLMSTGIRRGPDNNEIDSLINLKSMKKVRASKYEMDDDDAEDSSDVGMPKSRKKPKKNKKEEEQRMIDFFNEMDVADEV